jgi:hypothetical protein
LLIDGFTDVPFLFGERPTLSQKVSRGQGFCAAMLGVIPSNAEIAGTMSILFRVVRRWIWTSAPRRNPKIAYFLCAGIVCQALHKATLDLRQFVSKSIGSKANLLARKFWLMPLRQLSKSNCLKSNQKP